MPYVGVCRAIALLGGALFLLGLSLSHARHAQKYVADGTKGFGALAAAFAIACAIAGVGSIVEAAWAPALAAVTAATSLMSAHWYRRRTRLQLAADALTVAFVVATAGRHLCG